MFESWAKYLKRFNERFPNDKTTIFDVLEASYVDTQLLRILYAVEKNPKSTKELKALATDLQSALISKWLDAMEKPADLRRWFQDVPSADDMIDRYTQKLHALSGNTS